MLKQRPRWYSGTGTLRNPLIFERARFRRFSAVRPDAERTNRLTRALISRQRPSKIKNPIELIPYRGHFQSLCLTPGCKTPAAKNEGMAEVWLFKLYTHVAVELTSVPNMFLNLASFSINVAIPDWIYEVPL